MKTLSDSPTAATSALDGAATTRRKVPTRRISFEESLAAIPKHFARDGDLISSHLTAVLSSVFPDGEDFFVRSVRHFRDEITDPVLKKEVAGFIGQEAVHGREHRALNERLDELGYASKRIERNTKWGLELRERIAPPKSNLATTAALEHFTATFAEVLLSSEDARDLMGSPEMTDVFVWHALEECEHKAVAFDVYKAVGGTDRMRRWTMNFTIASFIGGISIMTLISLLGDRETYRRGRLRKSWKTAKTNPLFTKSTWRRLRDYNRRDFHPDDHDTDALLEEWRNELFGPEGRLNDKLAGAAA